MPQGLDIDPLSEFYDYPDLILRWKGLQCSLEIRSLDPGVQQADGAKQN